MFADIAGYTSMMQEDELLALEVMRKFKKNLEEKIAGHKGQVLELRGDGSLPTGDNLEGKDEKVTLPYSRKRWTTATHFLACP